MTTEDALHALLDTNPDNFTVRLILADWHQDHGDPRAEGYRALGRLGKFPQRYPSFFCFWKFLDTGAHRLPKEWFMAIQPHEKNPSPNSYMRSRPTRRELEDAAALAFVNLPEARRAQFLNAEPVTA